MSPEQAFEAIGRGMMQALLGSQDVAATKRRPSSRRSRASDRGTSARATTEVQVPPPIQGSMFEPPNANVPTPEELDKILGITRAVDPNPPGTYVPEQTEVKPWLAK